MTTTFPTSAPSATTRPPTFAVGTVVRVQHNEALFKIHSHAAWSDDDHQTPIPNGRFSTLPGFSIHTRGYPLAGHGLG